ncbi:MAG: Fmu (Sun) domain-containing protein [Bacteroidota bacterium]
MNRYERYLSLSADIIDSYNGAEPFASFLKKYFSQNKQLGSRDRKQISQCCYAFFRTGHLFDSFEKTKRIAAALFLCSDKEDNIIINIYPEWASHIELSLYEKCLFLGIEWSTDKIFPWKKELSEHIETDLFISSHLIQPDLFLRTRNNSLDKVIHKLDIAKLAYTVIGDSTIRLQNGTKVDEVLSINKEVIVQDYSSQQISDLFKYLPFKPSASFKVWDSCAASGGKSILMKDYYPNTLLTVSDNRHSILRNLESRFKVAGIVYQNTFVVDLSISIPDEIKPETFDLIIADVPCTGSGTWGRTPEWLHYFKVQQIDAYAELQFSILKNILPALKKGGYLIYITCSVFKEENERQVNKLNDECECILMSSRLIKGYTYKADTMYSALLQKKH